MYNISNYDKYSKLDSTLPTVTVTIITTTSSTFSANNVATTTTTNSATGVNTIMSLVEEGIETSNVFVNCLQNCPQIKVRILSKFYQVQG